MAVEVAETAHVHESLDVGLAGGLGAGGERLVGKLVDLLLALGRQPHEHLSTLEVSAIVLGLDERREERLDLEHDGGGVADDHARGVLVGELGVEGEADCGEERGRLPPDPSRAD